MARAKVTRTANMMEWRKKGIGLNEILPRWSAVWMNPLYESLACIAGLAGTSSVLMPIILRVNSFGL